MQKQTNQKVLIVPQLAMGEGGCPTLWYVPPKTTTFLTSPLKYYNEFLEYCISRIHFDRLCKRKQIPDVLLKEKRIKWSLSWKQ